MPPVRAAQLLAQAAVDGPWPPRVRVTVELGQIQVRSQIAVGQGPPYGRM